MEGAIDAGSVRLSLAGESLASAPARIRGRSLQDAIATLPGWATEDNGLLHTRGVDDGFLYVIDGVPVYERLDALNGNAPDTQSLASISVITGYVAPEFGYKAGGVIEVQSQPATERWRGTLDLGLGSNATRTLGAMAGGKLGQGVGLRLVGSSLRSGRFLDPVHPDNLHNTGSQATTSGGLDYDEGARDRVTLGWTIGRARYDVPNTDEQEAAGQDQRQRVWNGSVTGSWQRVWSDGTVMHVAAYHRRSGVELEGSELDVPLFAESDRQLARTGGVVGVTHQRGATPVQGGHRRPGAQSPGRLRVLRDRSGGRRGSRPERGSPRPRRHESVCLRGSGQAKSLVGLRAGHLAAGRAGDARRRRALRPEQALIGRVTNGAHVRAPPFS